MAHTSCSKLEHSTEDELYRHRLRRLQPARLQEEAS